MALNTAPSFAGSGTLSSRVAKQRPPARSNGVPRVSGNKAAGIPRGPSMNFGFDGAKSMGNLGNPKSMSMGFNPGGMGGPTTMSGSSRPQRFQGPPLMDSGMGGGGMSGGMVANTAPSMPPNPMNDGKSMTGFMPPPSTSGGSGFYSPGGGMPSEGELGGIFGRYPRQMDPRFRY